MLIRTFAAVIAGALAFAPLSLRATRAQCDYGLTTYAPNELDISAIVYAMTLFDDGNGPAVFLGGTELLDAVDNPSEYFSIAKYAPSSGLAPAAPVLDLDGTRDFEVHAGHLYAMNPLGPHRWTGTQWEPPPEGLRGWAEHMFVFDDGSDGGESLFVVTNRSTQPSNIGRLYKLNSGTWTVVAVFNHRVETVEVFDGRLYVSGAFTAVDGVEANRVAMWDGATWTNLGVGVQAHIADFIAHEVQGMAALFACGSFALPGGVTTDVAYLTGRTWHAVPAINNPNQTDIGPMAVWDNGDGDGPALYVAATIESQSSGDTDDNLYRFDAATQQWQQVGGTYRLPYSRINCMLPVIEEGAAHATLYVAGNFHFFNGVQTYGLARLLPQSTGGVEPLPSDPRALRGNVASMAIFDHDGRPKVHASGDLRGMSASLPPTIVARFEGDSWTSIGRGGGIVHSLQTIDAGDGVALYAAGGFHDMEPNASDAAVAQFAKWDGSQWTGMGTPTNRSVNAFCVHDDGSGPAIYGAIDNDRVAKWTAPGLWTYVSPTFAASGTFGASLGELVSFDDGSGPALYVAGTIASVNGVPTSNIARLRAGSSAWEPVGRGLSAQVRKLHAHNDPRQPRLIAMGDFGQPGAMAQWDGASWSAVGDLPALLGNLSAFSIEALTTFDDGSGPALIVSTKRGSARWDGSSWMRLPFLSPSAFIPHRRTLYMGEPFAIWSPGHGPPVVDSIAGGGAYELGEYVVLRAQVTTGGAFICRWRHNGVPLPDATSPYSGEGSLRLSMFITGASEGEYDLMVTNDCETIVSDPVTVDVIGSCVGDITADNTVNVSDLLAVIIAWGACSPFQYCSADLSHDGQVGVLDLLAVVQRWGPCP